MIPGDQAKKRSDNPPVVNGELVYVSPTSMQLFDRCPAAWRFKYVEGLPDKPPSKGQKRGIEGHGRIEVYLTTGANILDPLERLGIERGVFPTPGPDLIVEKKFPGLTALGVPVSAKGDLLYRRGPVPVVRDWKFKAAKTLRHYGLPSPKDLLNPRHEAGIQMLAYGAGAGLVYPDSIEIDIGHGTFQTEGPKDVFPVTISAPLTTIREGWETVSRRIIPPMREAARASNAHHVEKRGKTNGACEAYGGCAFKHTCLDFQARLAAGFRRAGAAVHKEPIHSDSAGGSTMGMLDQLKKIDAGAAGVVQPPPPAQPPPPPPRAPIEDKSSPAVEAIKAIQNEVYVVNGTPARFLCSVSMGGTNYASFAPLAGGPPLLVAPDLKVEHVPSAPAEEPKADAPAPSQAPIQAGSAAGAEEPKKRGPGRPPKAKKAEEPKAEPAAAPAAQVGTNATGATPAPTPAPTGQAADGVYLYFGCSPLGVPTTTLQAHVERLDAEFRGAEESLKGLVDLRCASDNVFGFGKWRPYLAKLAVAAEYLPPPGHYVVQRGADERVDVVADALAGVLASTGRVVIGGGR